MRHQKLLGLLASITAISVLQTSAALLSPIGVQFQGRDGSPDQTGNPGCPFLFSSDVAGVVAQGYWNPQDDAYSFTPANQGQTPPLNDTNGNPTTVTLVFFGNDSWYNDVTPTNLTTANGKLMNGILKASSGGGVPATFLFTNVPEGQYDVYVYTDMNGDNTKAKYFDLDQTTTYYVTLQHQFLDGNPFIQGTNTDPLNIPTNVCNYIKFSNLGTFGRGTIGVAGQWIAGNDGIGISGLQLVNTGPPAPSVAAAITKNPGNVTVNEGTGTTFTANYSGNNVSNSVSVGFSGTPGFSFQWNKNGAPIAGATGQNLTLNPIWFADNNEQISCTVSNNAGAATSAPAVVTVVQDFTKPALVGATAAGDFVTVTVTFSKPVDPTSAQNTANYSCNNGLSVVGATFNSSTPTLVVLTTSVQTPGTAYILTVNNVKDQTTGGNVIAPNSTTTFHSFVFSLGWATYQRWDGDTKNISAFSDAILYGTNGVPDVSTAVTKFDGPWNVADNYNSLHQAYFVAPFSGAYVFFIAADDQANLYLSTDDKPANKKLIAQETGWSNEYSWTTVGSGTLSEKRSDTFSNSEWPTPNNITLVQGNKYFVQILHHEGGGGDGDGATYIKQGDPDPSASGTAMQGAVIGTFLDPNGASLSFSKQPASTTGIQGKTATFFVSATGSSQYGSTVAYQWQVEAPGSSTFTNIPGASQSSYTTPILTLADTLTKYQVVCGVPALIETSSVATLTVIADTFPPVAQSATAFSGSTQVGLAFDEALDPVSAGNPANYKINGVAVTAAVLRTNVANEQTSEQNLISLIAAAPISGNFTVTISGLQDLFNNAMPQTNLTGKVIGLTSTDIGSAFSTVTDATGWANGPDPMVPTIVTNWGDGNFDVLCSGNDYYNNADGISFIWAPKTNSFDVKVRVVSVQGINNWSAGAIMVREGPVTAPGGGWELARHYFCKVDYGGPTAVLDGSGSGANTYEYNARLATGDPTLRETSNNQPGGSVGWGGSGPGNPSPVPFPDAWIRIARAKGIVSGTNSDHMLGYSSSDGVNWSLRQDVDLLDAAHAGHATLGGTNAGPLPDVMYVGLASTAHNNNTNATTSFPYQCWVIYRDFGDTPQTASSTPILSYQKNADGTVTLTFTGKLYSSATANGTYTAVTGAVSPYKVTPQGSASTANFYRAGP